MTNKTQGIIFLWISTALFASINAIKSVNSQNIAISNTFFPIAGVFFAYLIVGEMPSQAQVIGGVVILIGIGLYGSVKKPKDTEEKHR